MQSCLTASERSHDGSSATTVGVDEQQRKAARAGEAALDFAKRSAPRSVAMTLRTQPDTRNEGP